MCYWIRWGFVAVALLAFAGCNKGQQSAATGRPAARVAVPSAPVPEPAVHYETPMEQATKNNGFLGPVAVDKQTAKEAQKATPAERKQVREALLSILSNYKFTYDAKLDQIKSAPLQVPPIPVDKCVDRITAKILVSGQTISVKSAGVFAGQFLAAFMAVADAKAREKQAEKEKLASGAQVEASTGQLPPRLDPAKNVIGAWKSLREVNATNTYSVNHNDAYHELLTLKDDRSLNWVRYRNGQEFSRENYDWKYDPATGELTLLLQGKDYKKLKVYSTPLEPEAIYIETPGLERMTVFAPMNPPAAGK